MRKTKNYRSLPFNPALKQRARELRKAGNLSEVLLWNQLKRKQFQCLDFDRQKIIGNYIVDFYCAEKTVVIEVDGSSHDHKVDYDKQRDVFLQGLGLTVIHLRDKDIKTNLSDVMVFLNNHPALSGNFQKEQPPCAAVVKEQPPCAAAVKEQPPRQATPATPPEEGNV